ncbi:MAG TPA: SRPBCC family protein, partial [Kofleriaceae bacterium]|nr:SRPBCC family protein [Kofleriaceae bacterium]
GLTELAFPRTMASLVGVGRERRAPAILRALGLREIASGIAMLARPDHPAPRWARLVGDALDLGLLGMALTSRRSGKNRLALTLGAIAGIAVLDSVATRRTARARHLSPVIAAVTINKPPLEVYEFFRKLDQLPQFMDYLASVEPYGARRSTWTARLPMGGTVSWDAEIVEDRPGEVLSWRSVEGSKIQTRGRVRFTRAPGRDMTEVRVELQLGALGRGPTTSLARWFARPQVKADLQRLKQVIETGEVLYSDASVHRLPHAAQPSPEGGYDTVPKMFAGTRATTIEEVAP